MSKSRKKTSELALTSRGKLVQKRDAEYRFFAKKETCTKYLYYFPLHAMWYFHLATKYYFKIFAAKLLSIYSFLITRFSKALLQIWKWHHLLLGLDGPHKDSGCNWVAVKLKNFDMIMCRPLSSFIGLSPAGPEKRPHSDFTWSNPLFHHSVVPVKTDLPNSLAFSTYSLSFPLTV
jgi:hypothetical protein